MNKKGQFFLIAAFIVAALLISLTIVYNTAQVPKTNSYIYDLSSEINMESSQVIDNGVFTGNQAETLERIKNITDYYSQTNPESDLVILYGDKNHLTPIKYGDTETGTVCLTLSGSNSCKDISSTYSTTERGLTLGESKVSLNFSNYSYDFKLKEGQNFFIIIRKESGDENLVSSN